MMNQNSLKTLTTKFSQISLEGFISQLFVSAFIYLFIHPEINSTNMYLTSYLD